MRARVLDGLKHLLVYKASQIRAEHGVNIIGCVRHVFCEFPEKVKARNASQLEFIAYRIIHILSNAKQTNSQIGKAVFVNNNRPRRLVVVSHDHVVFDICRVDLRAQIRRQRLQNTHGVYLLKRRARVTTAKQATELLAVQILQQISRIVVTRKANERV